MEKQLSYLPSLSTEETDILKENIENHMKTKQKEVLEKDETKHSTPQKRVAYKIPLLCFWRLCFVTTPKCPLQKFRGQAVERKFSKTYCSVR